MLTAEDIRVSLGKVEVLHGVSAQAQAGEVTVIVGPNGSGKTTLLRALTGDVPYQGRVILNGQDCAGLSAWELAAVRGVLPQAAVLAFPFTVAEVVRLGLTSARHSGRGDLVARALAAVDLAGLAARLYQELSGGQQARVQLARVLVQVWEPMVDGLPRWLLLDEPVASLDIAHQLGVVALMRDYARKGGGVVAVLHDLNLTAMAADRVWLMDQGRLTGQGPVAEVLTDAALERAYGCRFRVGCLPPAGGWFALPQAAGPV
ncbi:heme ABC transporter ATP-binding protein [Pseudotabrizicola algicola]|uniref:Heme ABC transporter ATP-binding protein n=1 Tax=Pseudotabrizicola algicola TaxID=2709381 RepID=A0A6B3RH74_9RHOB|nr:heme ABC transporter ATP-binding protein [Pseudotabrizicola algicola]NEX45394.1 heme ABC transporter ATP-binding protein [Pseudotabrizicola algicola]